MDVGPTRTLVGEPTHDTVGTGTGQTPSVARTIGDGRDCNWVAIDQPREHRLPSRHDDHPQAPSSFMMRISP